MSMPNSPLLPGSKLEQAAKSRSTFSIAAFIFSAHVAVFLVVLLNGCNKESATTGTEPPAPTNQTDVAVQPVLGAGDTNPPAATPGLDSPNPTNPPGGVVTFPVPAGGGSNAPAPTLPPPDVGIGLQAPGAGSALPEATGAGSEYKVKSGDIAYNIAKTHGVSLKALKDANPNVDLGKLKVGQTIQLPAGGAGKSAQAPAAGVKAGAADESSTGGTTTAYTVKGGDTLARIAKKHGTTVKAIRSANNLSGDKINVGQKLKIPSKAGNAEPAEAAPKASADALPGTPVPAIVPPTGTGR
jgi:LysM repeat protein